MNKGTTQGNATSRTGAMARDATRRASEAASETASTMRSEVKKLLDRQVASGAERVSHFAAAAHRAAEELDESSPEIARLVRTSADRIEGYAGDLRDRSVNDLVQEAVDFTRRQPALVLGLSALVGFLALRTLKSTGHEAQRSTGAGEAGSQPGAYHGA